MNRSENMRRIRSKNSKPELIVRNLLRGSGFTGYRLHRKDIPGKPDIAFIGRRKAVFVNGCFWHGHSCAEGKRRPKTNRSYWLPKISGNQARDSAKLSELSRRGWSVITIWECELRNLEAVQATLAYFMNR